jgi:hypothetical protein
LPHTAATSCHAIDPHLALQFARSSALQTSHIILCFPLHFALHSALFSCLSLEIAMKKLFRKRAIKNTLPKHVSLPKETTMGA